jgi:hypothetical protein
MKRVLKWSTPRVLLGAALSIATVSFAFFLVTTFSAEGSHEGKTGAAAHENHALPLAVAFPDGITPTNQVPVTLEVENPNAQAVELAGPVVHIATPTDPICGEQWLEVWGETTGGEESSAFTERAAGTNTDALKAIPAKAAKANVLTYLPGVKQVYMRFKPSLVAGTDQTQCAEVPVKITAALTAPH